MIRRCKHFKNSGLASKSMADADRMRISNLCRFQAPIYRGTFNLRCLDGDPFEHLYPSATDPWTKCWRVYIVGSEQRTYAIRSKNSTQPAEVIELVSEEEIVGPDGQPYQDGAALSIQGP